MRLGRFPVALATNLALSTLALGQEAPAPRHPVVPEGSPPPTPFVAAPTETHEILSPKDAGGILTTDRKPVDVTRSASTSWKLRWPVIARLAGAFVFAVSYGGTAAFVASFVPAAPGWSYIPVVGPAWGGGLMLGFLAGGGARGLQWLWADMLVASMAVIELADAAVQLVGLAALGVGVVGWIRRGSVAQEHASGRQVYRWRMALLPAVGSGVVGVRIALVPQ